MSSDLSSQNCLTKFTKYFRPGSTIGSMFSLFAATFDVGIITLPYLAAQNGVGATTILIVYGAVSSYFTSMLLVDWADKIGKTRYQDFAMHCWGPTASKVVGWCNIISFLGFVISYIVFVKTLIPQILKLTLGESSVPDMLGEGQWKGELIWGTVYVIFIMLPLSIPKKIGSLEYFSTLGWICAVYITFCFIALFFWDKSLVPDISKNIVDAKYFVTSLSGIAEAMPYILFSYMFQPIVPIIYSELKNKSKFKMRKILTIGSIFVITIYVLDSTFGYLCLVNQQPLLNTLLSQANILEVDFGEWAYTLAAFGFLFTIFAAAQIVFLSAKSDFEIVVFNSNEMSKFQNIVLTVSFCIICWAFGVFVPTIEDAITILGCTVNPMSGYIFPIIFYLKMFRTESKSNWKVFIETIICWVLLLIVIGSAIMAFITFIQDKLNS